ncbi:MAG: heparinase II/III family protein [Phycisphaerae bacterium]|nr:heparinase II/III family protein [Phycisphaerae bacterium]
MAFLTACASGAGGNQLSVSPHPRLFFTAKNIKQFRERISRDEVLRQAWLKMRERADRLLEEELVSREYSEGGTGQHGNYGRPSSQVATMGSTLGLAYRMTGEDRYAEKLRQALIHYGKLSRWAGDAKRDPPWHSELNTARFCYGYAIAYDCIGDFLSETDRKAIAQSMTELGILPTLDDWVLGEKRIHALDSMGHNWWSVCVAMAALASLSLVGDEPQAAAWVERVSDSFLEWFYYSGNILQNKSTNFDAKGAFYESVNYANYALSEYLLFRLAYSNTYPGLKPPEIELLDKAGDFFIDTCYPTSASMLSANFGDSSLNANGAKTLRLLAPNGYEADKHRWYVNRTDPGLGDPIALVCCRPEARASIPDDLPHSAIYSDIGWAVMRSSWADDATMLAVKSGFAWNHAHPDSGSFILFHAGKPLIIDSGNCSYSRREYSSYYRQSKAHNVILHDGRAQNPEDCGGGDRGVVTSGEVHKLLDVAGFKYVLADATGPTSWKFSRNYRHFMWIDGVILIVDDVRTHEAGKLEWLLHYAGSVDRDGSDLIIANDQAKAIVRPLFPENMTLTEKKGLKDHDPDTEVVYLALSPQEPTREMKFVTAILPVPGNGESSFPRLERLTDREAIGVRIGGKQTVTDVYLNLRADGRKMHRNSNNIIDGWDTDAYLFAITRPIGADRSDPDTAQRYFIGCGSYLRKNGKVVLDSLSKVYTVFTHGEPELEVALQGQSVIRATLRTATRPRRTKLNGQATNATYDESSKTVTLLQDRR